MTIAQLQEMRPFLNLTKLAKQAGLNENTLLGKVNRGTELTVKESEVLEETLRSVGLIVAREGTHKAGNS